MYFMLSKRKKYKRKKRRNAHHSWVSQEKVVKNHSTFGKLLVNFW